jgi:hypothetical protein
MAWRFLSSLRPQRLTAKIKGFAPTTRAEEVQRRLILSLTSSASTDGSGNLAVGFNMNPSGAADWGIISTYYDEFRVIGVKVTFVSDQQFSVTKLNNLCLIIYDNDSVALNSFTSAQQYANKICVPAVFSHTDGKCFSVTYERPVTKQSPINWVDVASPSDSLGAVQIIGATAALTPSTQYFSVLIEWMCEVRGRR